MRTVSVTNNDDYVRVEVPMQSLYLPGADIVAATELLAIVVAPLWLIGLLIVRSIVKITPPPRASFEITRDQFRMVLAEEGSGQKTELECDRSDVIEIRKNRYSKGLWLHVRGKMQTYLQDLDDETIVVLSQRVNDVLDDFGGVETGGAGHDSKSRDVDGGGD